MLYITYDLKKDRELWRLEEKKYILEELQQQLRQELADNIRALNN